MKKLYLTLITCCLMHLANAQSIPLDASTTTPSVIYQDANNYIGIGTTTPASLLHINASSINYNPEPDYLTITRAAFAGIPPNLTPTTDTKFIVKADGKVGIGTAEPMGMLHLVSTEGFDLNKDFMGGNVWVATHNTEGFIGGLFDLSDDNEEAGMLVIQSHSNIPIPNTTPAQYDVIPAFGIMNKMNQMLNFAIGGDGTVAMGMDLTQSGPFENAAQFNLRSSTTHQELMKVESVGATSTFFNIHNNGCIGIGAANNNNATLQILSSGTNLGTQAALSVVGGSNVPRYIYAGSSTSPSNSTTYLSVKSTGTGIGIDDFSDLNSTLALKRNSTTGGPSLDIYQEDAVTGWNGQIRFIRKFEDNGTTYYPVRHVITDDYTNGNLVIQPGFGGNATNKLQINGKVQIGAQSVTSGTHADAKLHVDGKITAKHCVVTINNWADDVFGSNYNLTSISNLEDYIKTNKHLPDVPAECEVLENGISIGEMNATLLRKIEELTLYAIGQQKEIEALKQQMNAFQTK